MKQLVQDPVRIARETGGCTFEPGLGWWAFSKSPLPGAKLLHNNNRARFFMPTLTRNGRKISHKPPQDWTGVSGLREARFAV
ncbi:MAG: hypothetical protein WCJ29_01450 [bacterium]